MRIDYGGTVRLETRLGAIDENNFGISEAAIDYARPIYDEEYPGGLELRSITADYYYCDGRFLPMSAGNVTSEDLDTIERRGNELIKLMLWNPDVADFRKSLAK